MMNRYLNGGNIGNGNFGGGRCLGNGFAHGFMGSGGIILIIGVLIIIALLFFILVHNKKKKVINNEVEEILKMKYVKGEITEEEYLRRKEIIGIDKK